MNSKRKIFSYIGQKVFLKHGEKKKFFCLALFVLSKPHKSSIILVGVVGNISACHADARGSIPRLGVFFSVS